MRIYVLYILVVTMVNCTSTLLVLYSVRFIWFFFPPCSADLLLGSVDEYRFLTCGSIHVPGQSDSENFTQTMDSMAIMGFTEEEKMCKRGER